MPLALQIPTIQHPPSDAHAVGPTESYNIHFLTHMPLALQIPTIQHPPSELYRPFQRKPRYEYESYSLLVVVVQLPARQHALCLVKLPGIQHALCDSTYSSVVPTIQHAVRVIYLPGIQYAPLIGQLL